MQLHDVDHVSHVTILYYHTYAKSHDVVFGIDIHIYLHTVHLMMQIQGSGVGVGRESGVDNYVYLPICGHTSLEYENSIINLQFPVLLLLCFVCKLVIYSI